jgi:pimeloyl-ACP methyl ester carboxylesterase
VATFVVVHGAWGGAWSWNKFVVPRLRASGHTVFAATLTGLGDRTHLAHPGVDLDTHVQDVANVLFYEDLHDVILVGHSYGGRVITGVADTSADRLAHLVYLDAFVPTPENPGGTVISAASQARIDAEGDGWRNPPGDAPPDQPSEIIEWARPRRSWQPVKTFTQPVRFTNPVPSLARTYVYCSVGKDPSSPFAKLALQLRDDPAWTYHQLETGHNLHYTAPDDTVAILAGIGDAQDRGA